MSLCIVFKTLSVENGWIGVRRGSTFGQGQPPNLGLAPSPKYFSISL